MRPVSVLAVVAGATVAAIASAPVVARARRELEAFRTLQAIDIRTVNTVADDTKRAASRPGGDDRRD